MGLRDKQVAGLARPEGRGLARTAARKGLRALPRTAARTECGALPQHGEEVGEQFSFRTFISRQNGFSLQSGPKQDRGLM